MCAGRAPARKCLRGGAYARPGAHTARRARARRAQLPDLAITVNLKTDTGSITLS